MRKTKKILAVLLVVMMFMSVLTVTAKATVSTSVVFDAEFYLSKYADLRAAFGDDYDAAYNHFLTYGISEGRQASPLFDVVYYLNQYSDLQAAFGTDYEAAYNHFLTYGISEGRRSSYEFDVVYYLDQYSDLQDAFGIDYEAAYNHAATYGMSEGRNTSSDFTVTCYVNGYADLKAAFGSNYELAFDHYYLYGANEGRHTTHSAVEGETVEATCVEAGYSGGSTCEYCGEVLSEAGEIAATGEHDMTYHEAVAATCSSDGTVAYYTCANESEDVYYADEEGTEVLETIVVASTGAHTLADVAEDDRTTYDPTCTEDGYTEQYCTTCGKIFITVAEATGHTEVIDEDNTTAKCTEEGTIVTICSVCGETLSITTGTLDHSVSNYTSHKDATCTEEGYDVGNCDYCGQVVTVTIEMTDHTYDDGVVTTEQTCTETGIMTYTCVDCGATKSAIIVADGHGTWTKHEAVEATCTTSGNIEYYTCSNEGDDVYYVIDEDNSTSTETVYKEVSEDEVFEDATGHGTMTLHAAVAATCQSEGNIEYYTCSNEDADVYYVIDEDNSTRTETVYKEVDADDLVLAKTDHDYVETASEDYASATCTEDGYTVYVCSVCGDTYVEPTAATGHNYVATVSDATCTDAGTVTYTCSNGCGSSYTSTIDATGHTYGDIALNSDYTYYGDSDLVHLYSQDCEKGDDTLYYVGSSASSASAVEVITVTSEEELTDAIETIETDTEGTTYVILVDESFTTSEDVSSLTIFVNSAATLTVS